MKLKDKIVLITGAAQGIGEACAKLFISEGAVVIVSDIQDEKGVELAKNFGKNSFYEHLDVKEEKDWIRVCKLIKKQHSRLDILVNNAGITGFFPPIGPQDPEHASLESWQDVHRVNLDGVFLGCKYAISLMKAKGGSIVNISSRSGLVGIPRAAAYASSKAAIRNHTKTTALYCAEEGYKIRCNSIHPAAILTPMWDPMLGKGEDRSKMIKEFSKDNPMQRFGTASEVASVALFLASEDSSYVNGVELNVDGGMLAGVAAAPQVK